MLYQASLTSFIQIYQAYKNIYMSKYDRILGSVMTVTEIYDT